jgi:hypothetical protein
MRHEGEQCELKEYIRERNRLGINCTYMGDGTYENMLGSKFKRSFITQRNFEGINMLRSWLVKNKIPVGQKGILCFKDRSRIKHEIPCVFNDGGLNAIFLDEQGEDAGYALALQMKDEGIKPWRGGALTFGWTVEESDL